MTILKKLSVRSQLFILLSLLGLSVHSQSNQPPQQCSIGPALPDRYYSIVEGSNGREVLDRTTNFIWERCPWGMTWNGTRCQGEPYMVTWDYLSQIYPASRPDSQTEWRVPTAVELQTLVDINCRPAINVRFFPSRYLDMDFWTSNPSANPALGGQGGYYINFDRGGAISSNYRYTPAPFRRVRGIFKYNNNPQ